MQKRNNLGQYTKNMSILITKKMQATADNIGVNVKEAVKDKLDITFKEEIEKTYAPTSTGTYIDTGKLLESVHTEINDNVVEAIVEEDLYRNSKTTNQIYEYLKKGTTSYPKKDSYSYIDETGHIRFANYHPQPPHLFEQHTLNLMEGYLESLTAQLNRLDTKGLKRYMKKSSRKG